tara:strand:- start:1072 stop:1203 length:132 start_codon:yes stop_codon:yes gene_type:complete
MFEGIELVSTLLKIHKFDEFLVKYVIFKEFLAFSDSTLEIPVV